MNFLNFIWFAISIVLMIYALSAPTKELSLLYLIFAMQYAILIGQNKK